MSQVLVVALEAEGMGKDFSSSLDFFPFPISSNPVTALNGSVPSILSESSRRICCIY